MSVFRVWFKFSFKISDDDAFIPSSVGKKKTDSNGHSKAADKAVKAAPSKCEEKPKEKLKPVTPDDFFAKAAPTTKLPKIPKIEKKGKFAVLLQGEIFEAFLSDTWLKKYVAMPLLLSLAVESVTNAQQLLDQFYFTKLRFQI